MLIFVRPDETEIIAVGVAYLRIEGAFYCGIGILFCCTDTIGPSVCRACLLC